MANTLRRKMFKLGGEVNTHGVGITSGLEYRRPGYNAGGQVQATFGVGNNANKMIGPDGREREGHSAGIIPVLKGIGNLALLGIPKILSKPARTYGYRGTEKISRKVDDMVKEGLGTKDDVLKAFTLKELAKEAGVASAGRLGKAITYGAPALYGTGVATALGERAGVIDPERTNLEKYGTMGTQTALDYLSLPGYGYPIGQTALDTPGVDSEAQSFSNLISGKSDTTEEVDNKNLGSKFVPTGDVMEMAQTQEEQFAKMQADADTRAKMYYNMLSDGGPDKLRALGDAFTNFGALYDEDKVSAIAGFNQGITGELDRDAAIKDEARRLGLSDIIGDEAEIKQDAKAIESAKNSIMTNPDLSTRQKIDAVSVFDSYLSGITETVPTNAAGNELNTDAMKANSVYLDPEKISGSSFVAVDRLLDIRPFNNKEEAKAHAES